jgi:UrcA family protein
VQANPILIVTETVRTERVQTADLNLKSAAGRAALEGRIRAAANKVCEVDGDRSLETRLNVAACYSVALADGVRQGNAAGGTSVLLLAR